MATEVLMPRQGQSVESCIILEWRVKEGDKVNEGDAICEVETDKATFEVEATATGTILGIFYPDGEDVEVLKVIAAIGEEGENIDDLRPADNDSSAEQEDTSATDVVETAQADTSITAPTIQAKTDGIGASPRAKTLANAKGISLNAISGTGPEGRVIERDVQNALVSGAPLTPAAQALMANGNLNAPAVGSGLAGRVLASDLSTASPSDAQISVPTLADIDVPVKGVRKLIAERMKASLSQTAQLTLNASADARQILAYRKECKNSAEALALSGITINDIVMYATVQTLKRYPELNAHFLGDTIRQFGAINLGFAVDTPKGLLVPNIKNAQAMSLKELSMAAKSLATSAIDGSIEPDALSGGTFTITNLGSMGIESFTPVLNAPEVAILGVCTITPRPVMNGSDVEFVPHMGLSLTFDHAAADGAPAGRFLKDVVDSLAHFNLTLAG